MKFVSRAVMEGNPEFKIQMESGPVAFQSSATGALKAEVSAITARVDEIPIRVSIPFLPQHYGPQMVAAIGGFGIKVNPFSVAVEAASINFEGVLGTDGVKCDLQASVGCKTTIKMDGKLFGKIANIALELPEEDFEQGVEL